MKFWPFNWGAKPKAAQAKTSEAGMVISHVSHGTPVWAPKDYEKIAKEAYQANAIAYRCIKLIATAAASVPFLLQTRDGKDIDQHPLLDLLSRPSPVCGGTKLFEQFYAYLLMSGNTYIEAVGPERGAPKELWTLRPDRMKVIKGSFGIPRGFEYEANGIKKVWQVDQITGEGPILHMKEFHPTEDWYGLPRVDPASYAIDRHNQGSEHNSSLLTNGARPSGALVFKPVSVGSGHAPANAPKEVIEAAEERLTQKHGGPENAGKPFALGGDVEWVEMGMTPRDMDFEAGMEASGREICTAFGVPHILIIQGQATYNNVKEAKLELYEDTILPLVGDGIDHLNNWLTPHFADNLWLKPDLDQVSALEPRREAKRTSSVELFDKRVITRKELREELQYGDLSEEEEAELDASVKADIAFKKAQVFQIDVNSGLFDDTLLREARAAQLSADGVYPGAKALNEEPDEEPVRFDDDGSEEDKPSGNPNPANSGNEGE